MPSLSPLVARLSRVWAPLVVSVLLLGPVLLSPGYLLTYDMVWVPDLALRSDFLGLGSGVPRAVPSDAWVAVLDEVIPGMVLQKLVLLGSLVAGGVGIQRWVTDDRVSLASTAAAALYLWNPYVVERLAIGHWPMLVCYGLLPWVARAVQRSVTERRPDPVLLVLLPLASLNASAGIATAVAVVAFGLSGATNRTRLGLGAVTLVANLPWLVAGVVKAGLVQGLPAGAEVFAPAAEGSLPAPLATLTLGGLWNTEIVPASRTTALAWVSLVVVIASLLIGRRTLCRRGVRGWWWCALVGWGLAVLGWAAPGAIDALAQLLPGAGVLRDGSRLLLLLAPLVAIGFGAAVDRLVGLAGEAAPVIGAFCVLLPVALLPDAAWGMTGDLRPAAYPESFTAMRAAVEQVHEEGDVLVLPFTAYRAPEWNGYRKVFDPVGRFQDRNYLASDSLAVSGRQLGGEDPRGDDVLEALRAPTPERRATSLAELGIGVVVVDRRAAEEPGQEDYVAPVDGHDVGVPDFDVIALASPAPTGPSLATLVVSTIAWLAFAAQFLCGIGGVARRVRRQ